MATFGYYFKPRSAFHFGIRGVGLESTLDYAPSDTLFSAFCVTWRLLHNNQSLREDIFAPFTQRLPHFLHSGAFPYIKTNESTIRFYPAPTTIRLINPDDVSEKHQKIIKAEWLSETLFFQWVKGEVSVSNFAEQAVTAQPKVYVTESEKSAIEQHYGDSLLWTVGDVPHVAVDRVQSAGNIFQVGRLWFVDVGGLWSAFHVPTQSTFTEQKYS